MQRAAEKDAREDTRVTRIYNDVTKLNSDLNAMMKVPASELTQAGIDQMKTSIFKLSEQIKALHPSLSGEQKTLFGLQCAVVYARFDICQVLHCFEQKNAEGCCIALESLSKVVENLHGDGSHPQGLVAVSTILGGKVDIFNVLIFYIERNEHRELLLQLVKKFLFCLPEITFTRLQFKILNELVSPSKAHAEKETQV
ncbi:MAG: hypothetical protein K0U23_04720, partial [Gammaproteobacteria bacterium]|nr:hypothetical protein [Gammaproteobacteria bacterium]